MMYWRAATDMAFEKPLFGQGYAMFDPHFWDYMLDQQKQPLAPFYHDMMRSISGVSPEHVHNDYLEILAEQGFAGLVALAAFLLFFLCFGYWALLGQRDTLRAMQGITIFGAFITILVDAFFGFPWHLPVSLIVFMVVLGWLYELIYPQDGAPSGG
jgi:O-antigen ligase